MTSQSALRQRHRRRADRGSKHYHRLATAWQNFTALLSAAGNPAASWAQKQTDGYRALEHYYRGLQLHLNGW
jgi:hypothetical protein